MDSREHGGDQVIDLKEFKNLSAPERDRYGKNYLLDRERGRTDLLWFCRNVLGYRDIQAADPGWEDINDKTTGENHSPLINGLHHFAGRKELFDPKTFRVVESIERVAMYDQKDEKDIRNWLFLYPRDHLKTSILTIGHALQWTLNYPDVRILLSFSSGDHGDRIMTAILGHFRYNANFRYWYPEFCPQARTAKEFGSLGSFTVPNRTRQITEPTCMAVSVGKMIAGTHQDVHIHSDLVDKENIKTAAGIQAVSDHFKYTDPLLARVRGKQGWRIVEGTAYDYSDLYGEIRDGEAARPEDKRNWHIIVRSGEVSSSTKKVLWPHRYDWKALQKIKELVGLYIYEAQYNQRCIAPSGGLATKDEIRFIPRHRINELMPRYRIHTTVDLAGMEEKSTGAFCALTTCGFLPSGYIHVLDIRHGHFTPFQVINHFFDIAHKFRPRDFKMEKNHHAQVLEPFLRQEMAKRGDYINVLNIPRDNTVSKDNRISGLQSWFAARRILFADDLDCAGHLVMEITRFNKYKYKDILDTLADQLQHAEGRGIEPDLYPMADPMAKPPSIEQQIGMAQFMGFDPLSKEAIFGGSMIETDSSSYHARTGL
jgi:hypothetical protein